MKQISKTDNLLSEVNNKLKSGDYRYVGHANKRLQERKISRSEVKQVLRNGYHEKRKDQYSEKNKNWNYSIKGKTIDKKNLRVVISFDTNNMLIITVINLDD